MNRIKQTSDDKEVIEILEDGLEGILISKGVPYVKPEGDPKPEGGLKHKKPGQ